MRSHHNRFLGILVIAIGFCLAVPAWSFSAVPDSINFQGILRTSGGSPVPDGIYSVTFGIYPVPAGGTLLWSEPQNVSIVGGLFTVILGQVIPLPDLVFSGPSRFLSITVSPDPEMSPRMPLVTVPYAHRISTVDGATGGSITGDLQISGKATIGPGNTNTGLNAFVAGQDNIATGDYATVGGGNRNAASGLTASIGGGSLNIASGHAATVPGGEANIATGDFSTIGGGKLDSALGTYATVAGGYGNAASGTGAAVGGGTSNAASGERTTVAGGVLNAAGGLFTSIGGGASNVARGWGTTIAGGESNSASSDWATVGGGYLDTASSGSATVGGGYRNIASGGAATVPGGSENTAAGIVSFAAGYRAKANHFGSFVWADLTFSDFASNGDNTFSVRCTGGARFVSAVDGLGNPTAGVSLAAGGGSWSSISDRNAKENVHPVDASALLARLAAIPVATWNYKSQDRTVRHIGPMAQDFYSAFGVGEDDKHITTIDADGVALAAIQELYRKSLEIDDLRAQLNELRELVAKLQARQTALEDK